MSLAPLQEHMLEGPSEPWKVGAQNMYNACGAFGNAAVVPDGPPPPTSGGYVAWGEARKKILNDWGQRREEFLHRPPRCLMDQMVSGSGLFPLRLLNDTWFTKRELGMISKLEQILQPTGRARDLARDMLAPVIYGIEVKIVLDDSGSMAANMFGKTWRNASDDWRLEAVTQPTMCCGLCRSWRRLPPGAPAAISPWEPRWRFATDALRRWHEIYSVMGIDPPVYQMNGPTKKLSDFARGGGQHTGGRTPTAETLYRALTGRTRYTGKTLSDDAFAGRRLVLILTDGEANDMGSFMRLLDQCQNGRFGDIQICMLGVSLVPEDIEWFEEEECDETRIRTVEAFEVEKRQIQLKEVMQQEAGYNFDLHSVRALVTNFFPADYDYEAPLQNLRHRLYITLHGRDRWYGDLFPPWACLTWPLNWGLFIATGACCCGWLQGNPCGACRRPELCPCDID